MGIYIHTFNYALSSNNINRTEVALNATSSENTGDRLRNWVQGQIYIYRKSAYLKLSVARFIDFYLFNFSLDQRDTGQ